MRAIYTEEERKERAKISRKKWADRNHDKILEADRRYKANHPEKIKEGLQLWRSKNKDYIVSRNKEWRKNNPEKLSEQRKRQKIKQVFISKIHKIVFNAVRSGEIIKPLICEKCFSEEYLEGHHHDYTKPLEISWLCRTCHKSVHRDYQQSEEVEDEI
jgi:hypothetical protein